MIVFQNLEKVFKHRDLKEKLLETKLTQANVLLKEAEEKHKLERELVRSAYQICRTNTFAILIPQRSFSWDILIFRRC